MEKYSFLTSAYVNTDREQMAETVASMKNQTLPPDQIVLVCDGPLSSDVDDYVKELETDPLFTVVRLPENVGLGNALREGTAYCKNELIARIDTDDVNVLDRCEKQVAFFSEHPETDVVGSNMPEFIGAIDNVVAIRDVPETHEEICAYLKKRCPFNHSTVMMKKSALEKAGGYLDWHFNEDSYLWVRMYLSGAKFYNIQENLVYFRTGEDMYRRRGGYKYFKSERDLFRFMRKNKVIGVGSYAFAVAIRFVIQVLIPNWLRQFLFIHFMRKKPPKEGK